MKTVTINLYSFDELGEEVKAELVEKNRWLVMDNCMEAFGSDYMNTIRKFEELTETTLVRGCADYCSYHYDFKFDHDVIFENPLDADKDIDPENLTGKLLFRYIDNNIIPYLTKGKYYFVSRYTPNGYMTKDRRSKVFRDMDDCPMTGVCYDMDILDPLLKYYRSWNTYPESYSLKDLMDDCYCAIFKAWHEEYQYWATDDAVREELKNNYYSDALFYENGTQFNGPADNED